MEHLVGKKFRLGRKIGSGSFGEIHLGSYPHFRFSRTFLLTLLLVFLLGTHIQTNEEVAIKLVSSFLCFALLIRYCYISVILFIF